MDLISKLEKRFGSWAIPNLSVYLIAIQVIGVVMLMGGYVGRMDLILHGSSVFDRGEWWRLLSFMMIPKTTTMIWLLISWWVFYMIGNALERQWGTFRFNLFILSGYLLTVLMSVINPGVILTNFYFLGVVFLAFATLFPNFEFLLLFILPVKVKWLGWLTAGWYIFTLVMPIPDSIPHALGAGNKLCILAALLNYLLFFGRDFFLSFKAGQRRKAFEAERAVVAAQPLHTCAKCGITDKTDESMHFRYCSACGECFCEEHISDHDHEQ